MWNVTLLTIRRCSLCKEARFTLESFSSEQPLRLWEIDVGGNDALWRRYRFEVPVLFINGKKAANHRVSIKRLKAIRRRLQSGLAPMRPRSATLPFEELVPVEAALT